MRQRNGFVFDTRAVLYAMQGQDLTVRKIAVLFDHALRYGMDYVDPGTGYYEGLNRERVVKLVCLAPRGH